MAITRLPVFRPKLPIYDELKPFLERIDDSRRYSNFGPLSRELEIWMADYLCVPDTSLVSLVNGTIALEGAISTLSVDDWLCPSWTFAATPSAILRSNRSLVFIDVADDWRIGSDSCMSMGNAIVEVLPFGDTIDFTKWISVSKSHRILIDAAASFDSLKGIGNCLPGYDFGLMISLHATKILPAGEGAIFMSNDLDWVDRVRRWSNFGFNDDRKSTSIGTNGKMNEYSAAVGLASMQHWASRRDVWVELGEWMQKCVRNLPLKLHPAASKGLLSPYFIVEGEDDLIMRIRHFAEKLNIQTRDWWEGGCHEMPAFSGIRQTTLSNTEKLSRQTIGLPVFLDISNEERWRVEDLLTRSALVE